MDGIASISTDHLLADLRLLCGQPSSTGHVDALKTTARLVTDMLEQAGLQTRCVATAGAPVVIGWRAGRSDTTLLLYHHYDVLPPGPWRTWMHEPFALAERDGVLYARGVAQGKGPLVAHLQAVRALLHAEDELPCGLVVVVEGEGLQGSAHLAEVVAHYAHELRADACLSTAGERDQEGSPFCYGGSKGLLRVQLDAHGSAYPLPAGMATSVSNPVWRLTWALNQIKGEDEDIRINGFYDRIGGPSKGEREILRAVALDEAGRCEAWQIPAFLFNMSGVALVRSEVTLPTCNISSFVVEPATSVQCVPVAASAQLDFQLVPDQQPDDILALLRKHLLERSFEDIDIVPLPGSYSPVREAVDQPFVQCLANIGTYVYGTAFAKMPLGSFAQPLHVFASQFGIPVAALALARQTSAIHGANEHILLDDLVRHGQVLAALMNDYAENFGQIAIPR